MNGQSCGRARAGLALALLGLSCDAGRSESPYSALVGKCVCLQLEPFEMPCGILADASRDGLTLVRFGSRVVYPAARVRSVAEQEASKHSPGAAECRPK